MIVSITYVLLFIIMIFVLYFSGAQISRSESYKHKNSGGILGWMGVIFYTLNEGLRFGRGIDYNLYFDVYHDINVYNDSSFELLFTLLVKFFGLLGLPWQAFVIFMSFMFILSVTMVAKHFKPCVGYIMAFLPLFSMFAENIMRQTLGLSFFLIGFSFLLNDKIKLHYKYCLFLLFSLMGGLCHTSIFLLIPIFILINLFDDIIFIPRVSVPLFIVFTLFFQSSFMSNFYNIVTLLMITNRFAAYESDMDSVLMGNNDYEGLTISYSVSLVYIITICLGYKLKFLMGHKYVMIYNLMLIGFLTYPLFNKIELFSRISMMFQLFTCIPLGCSAYYLFKSRLKIYKFRMYLRILFVIVSLNYLRTFIIPPFKHPYTFQYVWDSNGRNVLNIGIYKDELEKK